ncbi:MAG: hypothetical protein WA208_06335 [Thermoanaerobaculia bacterium]
MNALDRALARAAILALASALTLAGCTGGSETRAADEKPPARHASKAETAAMQVDAEQSLRSLSPSIPLYPGAEFRSDLTRRDEAAVRAKYGPNAEVYTLGTDDSFPQVFHYYTTFLAQYRAFPAQQTYPPERRDWRTLEIQLDQAMQDPFIPGVAMTTGGKRVVLQLVETEAEPPTVIRYIVAPLGAPPAVATASAHPAGNIVVTR